MRRRVQFAAAVATGAFGVLAACGQFGSDTSAVTDAGPDGAPTDAPPADGAPTDAPAADGSAADADADAFSPSDLGADLVLWLSASRNLDVAGGKVSAWHDLSSFDATAMTPAGANAPEPSDGSPANGNPAVKFQGNNVALTIPDGTRFHWGTRNFYVVTVVRDGRDSGATIGPTMHLFARTESVGGHNGAVGIDLDGYVHGFAQGDDAGRDDFPHPSAAMSDKAYHLVGMRRTASNAVQMRLDGDVRGYTPKSPANLDLVTAPPVEIGGTAQGAPLQWDVDLAEMIVVSSMMGIVSDATVKSIDDYLRAKYATPP